MRPSQRPNDDSPDEADAPRRFSEAWRAGPPPDVGAFLAAVGPLSPLTLAAVVRVDQRERWTRGDRRAAEHYLQALPVLRADDEAALDVVVAEFLLRKELGETPTAAEYAARFPAHATVLADHFLLASLLEKPLSRDPPRAPEEAEQAAPGSRVRLTVTDGPLKGKSFTFDRHDVFRVGRAEGTHFRLPEDDPHVSRNHFLLEVNPPQCRLLDLGSRNGTFVNGQRVAQAELKHGDLIQGGRTVFRVDLVDGARAGPAPSAPLAPLPGAANRAVSARSRKSFACPTPRSANAPTSDPGRAAVSGRAPAQAPSTGHGRAAGFPPQISGYKIIRELGRGSMGVVFLARREADGGCVAIKTVTPSRVATPNDVRRLLREADILRQLDHPNIVRFLDLGDADGVIWFAMEYVDGDNAAQHLRAARAAAIPEAVAWVDQLLVALAHAHARGFVHRDVKPSNLLVGRGARRGFISLTDFGLARVYQASTLSGLTLEGQLGGTLGFMPPEQLTDFRNVSPAADQYSAAATLYTLLCGKAPFDFPNEFSKRLDLILTSLPVPLRQRRGEVSRSLEAVISRALAKDPTKRFLNIETFRLALQEATR